MVTRNLRPFQYQLGDLVFGAHTQYPVLGVKPQSYTVKDQDFQVPLADETRMGQDTLQGTPITFTIGVKDNAPVRYIAGSLPADLVLKSSRLLTALQKEWKADDVRKQWGELKPLIFCDGYGSTRRIYGRPRKFDYTRKTQTSQFHKVTAEYARIDTLSYDDIETVVSLVNDAEPVYYTRAGGDAQAWYRILLYGPMYNPVIDVGVDNFIFNGDILAGDFVEISSYPWQRRVISNHGINLRTKLIGNTKYLDQPKLPPNTSIPMSWSATLTGVDSKCLVVWRDAYHIF